MSYSIYDQMRIICYVLERKKGGGLEVKLGGGGDDLKSKLSQS